MQVAVGGGSTNRPAFLGNSIEPGTAVTLTPGSSYSVTETPVPGYTQRMPLPAECSGTISAGQTKTCTIINDDKPPQTPEETPQTQSAARTQEHRDSQRQKKIHLLYLL